MKLNYHIIIYSILLGNSVSVFAIQKTTARVTTGVIAASSTALCYKQWPHIQSLSNNRMHPICLGAAGALITSSVYSYLYSLTPEGRLAQANVLMKKLARHKLIQSSFNTDRAFFDAVHDNYLTHDLPLISAYNHLILLIPSVQTIFHLIQKAALETNNNNELKQQCRQALLRIKALQKNISHAIKRIREHKDYLPQLQIYKEFLVNDKQAVAQEHMAYAQIQMAHAQQSSTLAKWFKALFR
jgi:hypothetical protein